MTHSIHAQAERLLPIVALAVAIPCMVPGLVAPWFALTLAGALLAAAVAARFRLPLPGSPVQNTALALLIVLCVPLSILVSPLPGVSMQTAAVFVWCIGAMLIAEGWISVDPRRRALLLLSALAIVFTFVALLTMEAMPKFPLLARLNGLLPHLGGFAGIPEGGLPANELGGMAAFLLPFFAASLFTQTTQTADKTGNTRGLLIAALLLTGAVLMLAQSRGAFIAALMGTVLALALSGSKARFALGALLAVLIAAIALAGIDTLTGMLSYHRRFDSWLPIFTGRDDIWLRAWMLIRDVPVLGMGFGTFGHIVADAYPYRFGTALPIEDAHNLALQTALDLGVAGAVLFIAFGAAVAVSLLRSWRSAPSPITAGLLGACVAYGIYNLSDAVALGSPGGLVVFALIAAARAQSATDRQRNPPHRGAVIIVVVLFITTAGALSFLRPIGDQWRISRSLAALTQPGSTTTTSEKHIAESPTPNALWYAGLLEGARGYPAGQTRHWKALALRRDEYIPFMAQAEPANEPLAREVYNAAPKVPAAAFWLARIIESSAPTEAAALYRRGLAKNSADGLAWLGLGNALQSAGETAAAHRAYVRACFNDDPGLNGCWRAGLTAEALRDTTRALKYYDISNFIGAKQRAKQLRASQHRNGIQSPQ